jgi:ABC-2 type transport system permease protein
MNGNLFKMEIRRNAAALIIWSVIICLMITITMMVYPTYLANQSKVIGMLNIIPKGMLQFKGISDINDLASPLGFYSINNVIYMMLLGSIYSIVLSSGIIIKEEYHKTAEYLLARPLSRSEIFISKTTVVLLNIFLLNLITSLIGFAGLEIVKTGPYSMKAFLTLSLNTFLLNLFFGSAGLLISVLVKRARPLTSLGIGIVMVLYFIYTISKISESVSFIGYVSPFRYVSPDVFKPSFRLNMWHPAVFAGIILILSLISWKIYLKRDIYI